MLNLIGPSSQLHFTSLSSSSIPPLQKYLKETTPSSSSKAHLHTDPILTLVEKLGSTSARVCLLDPRAPKELAPEDEETFDIFLYGGILGTYTLPSKLIGVLMSQVMIRLGTERES